MEERNRTTSSHRRLRPRTRRGTDACSETGIVVGHITFRCCGWWRAHNGPELDRPELLPEPVDDDRGNAARRRGLWRRLAFEGVIHPSAERSRRHDTRTSLLYSSGQGPIRGHDREGRGLPVVGNEFGDVVIGGVSAASRREGHGDRTVDTGRHVPRLPVEHDREVVARSLGEPVELMDQSLDGGVGVVPPPVGARPDDVHAVDEPADLPAATRQARVASKTSRA